ncbi:Por secretion system C-terminal sorting domain-containing protein [Dyadobacter soli]|uniref:Por secretion system C-terminal sorting domain-containing protein n=1 Tax=Dyadobacter soli TaxID=659014 RepID=A0A1G8CKZ7_9BACT|nr:fibronectin type III domain-containing protein [Dyadobacter soli]SDH46118.1 Por secretion system C-terminal sorting domain-containing protein [Dyadobacter soli]
MKNRTIHIMLGCLFFGIGMLITSKTCQAQRVPTLRANVVSYQQVDLSWDRLPATVEVFVVERKEDGPGQNFAPISGNLSGNTFSYQDKTVQENRTYIYRVLASCDKSCGATLNEVKVTTPIAPPAAPGNLEAFYISGRGMAITWIGNNSDGTTFILERSENGGGYNLLSRVPYARSLSYNDASTTDGNTYCYRVKAVNSSGESGYSNESCVSRATPKPAAPSGLSASVVNARQINLAWTDNASNETGFEVERSPDGANFSKIGDAGPDAKSYEDKGVNPKTKYWYRVFAKNAGGASGYSNTADATTPDEAPNAPQRLSAHAVSNTQVDLFWADLSNNETGFELERSTDGNAFSKLADLPANATTYSNTGLATLTKYWYRVRAKNAIGNSEFSNVADATTFDVPPGAPTSLTAKTVSSSQISISWKDNATNEARFELERSTDGTSFSKIADIDANKTTYENTGLQPATKYWYRIRSANGSGPSIFSNVADATTLDVTPNAPTNLTAVPLDFDLVQLRWSALSANATEVIIERSKSKDKDFKQIGGQAASIIQFPDREILAVADYFYRITAVNQAGSSQYSNVAQIFAASIITGTEPANVKNQVYCANKTLFIDLPQTQSIHVNLCNILGQKQLSFTTSATSQTDLSSLPTGIYIVNIETDKSIIRQKIALF